MVHSSPWSSAARADDRRCSAEILVDTDVLSWIALGEGRADEFAALLVGHQLFTSFVTVAEVRTFLSMDVLGTDRADVLREGLSDYAPLPIRIDDVVAEWVRLRAATIATGSPDDRERRQNDTWIAACALSVVPPLPVVTGNLRDFTVLAAAGRLRLVHPDRPQSTQPRRA